MSLSDTSKSSIVFKLLQKRAHTSVGREVYNESEYSSLLMHANEVLANEINSDPDHISNQGIVKKVTLNLYNIYNSSGYNSYKSILENVPDVLSLSNIKNPRIGGNFSSGQRVGFIIPPAYGEGFTPIVRDKDNVILAPGDASDWVIDYFSGIITHEVDGTILNLNGTDPLDDGLATIECYIYIGSFVSDVLSISGSNVYLQDLINGVRADLESISGASPWQKIGQGIFYGGDISGASFYSDKYYGNDYYGGSFYGDGSNLNNVSDEIARSSVISISANIDNQLLNYATLTTVASISAYLNSEIATIAGEVTNSQLTAVSGTLQTKINEKLDTTIFQALSGYPWNVNEQTNTISYEGIVQANYFVGDGSLLTNISGALQGPVGPSGAQGIQGIQGLQGDPADFLNVNSNIVPDTNNQYSIGTSGMGFRNIYLDSGNVNISGNNNELYVNDWKVLTQKDTIIETQLDGSILNKLNSNTGRVFGVGQGLNLTQEFNIDKTFKSNVVTAGDMYGSAVSIKGDVMVIGEPNDSSNTGAIHISERVDGTWTTPTKYVPEDMSVGQFFGTKIDVYGNTIVVGSESAVAGAGVVYIYEKGISGVWGYTRIDSLNVDSNGLFGSSVAIYNNKIAIGAEGVSSNTGIVYILEKQNGVWVNTDTLTDPSPITGERFGASISMSVDKVVVGAPNKTTNTGEVIVFTSIESGGYTSSIITSVTPQTSALFGYSVDIYGDAIVIGERGNNKAYRAYYNGSSWSITELDNTGVLSGDAFGESVSIYDNKILVGANIRGAGYVYFYDLSNSTEPLNMNLVGSSGDRIGTSVAIDNNDIIVGAPLTDANSQINSGIVYVIKIEETIFGDFTEINTDLIPISGSVYNIGSSDYNWNSGYFSNKIYINNLSLEEKDGVLYFDNEILKGDNAGSDNTLKADGITLESSELYTYTLTNTISGSEGETDDNFGISLSSSTREYFVGSPNSNSLRGKVYVYEDNLGSLSTTILEADFPANGDLFGSTVANTSNLAVIGAPGIGSNIGGFYIYEKIGGVWTFNGLFTPPSASAGHRVGSSVAIYGGTIIVGADGADSNEGAIFIYRKTNDIWDLAETIKSSDISTGDRFGSNISIANDILIVSSIGSGKVYVFRETATNIWTEEYILTGIGSNFGQSISTDGNTIVVGSPLEPTTGVIYVYTRVVNSWNSQIITALGLVVGDEFGEEVYVKGNLLLASSVNRTSNSGSVFVFQYLNGVWNNATEITNPSDLQFFGSSLSIERNNLIIGVGDNPFDLGKIFVYSANNLLKVADGGIGLTQLDSEVISLLEEDKWDYTENNTIYYGGIISGGNFWGDGSNLTGISESIGLDNYATLTEVASISSSLTQEIYNTNTTIANISGALENLILDNVLDGFDGGVVLGNTTNNLSNGNYSIVMGSGAQDGGLDNTFVWSDGQGGINTPSQNKTFNIFSTNGVYIEGAGLYVNGVAIGAEISNISGGVAVKPTPTIGQLTSFSAINQIQGIDVSWDGEKLDILGSLVVRSISGNSGDIIISGPNGELELSDVKLSDKANASSLYAISGNLQTQITSNDADILTLQNNVVSISASFANLDLIYATDSDLISISGNLQSKINSIDVSGDISSYVDPISASLQTQIWSNDSDIEALQSTVISISGNLQSKINSIDVSGDISSYVDPISASLQTQIWSNDSDIESLQSTVFALSGAWEALDSTYATDSMVASISGNLQSQINNKLDISYFASISGSLTSSIEVTITGASLGRYVSNIGDGINSTITVTHNLVTEDVVVSLRNNITNELEFTTVEITDVNNIKLYFLNPPDINEYSVVVIGNSDFTDIVTISTLQALSADLYSLDKTNILDFNENDYVHTVGDEIIGGNKTFSNDIVINGTLTVAGSATTLNTQHVLSEDNLIVVNYGETGSGVTSISAGIQIDRGTENDYYFIYDETSSNFRIGEADSLQAVATRDDNIVDQSVVIWDDSSKKFIDSNFTIAQISGGSNISDIKDTYVTTSYQTSNYTITNSTSTVVPVISISGGFDVTPNSNVENGTRFRVHDIGQYCGTNPVTISGGALGKINTDGGAIEFAMSSLGWTLIDKFENIFDRNEITNEVSLREGETLVANKFVTPSGGEGLEVRNSLDEIVALIDENGKIQGRSGEFGIIGAEYTKTAQGDFTAIGASVDTTVTDEFGNKVVIGALLTGTITTDDVWDGGTTKLTDGIFSTYTYTTVVSNTGIIMDHGTPKGCGRYRFGGGGTADRTPRHFKLQGSTDGSSWVDLDERVDIDGILVPAISDWFYPSDITEYKYHRFFMIENNGNASFFDCAEIQFSEGTIATSDNTFDTNLATGTAGTFAPSSFLTYDETNTLISGVGKINVAYSIDGGAFVGGEEVADNPFNDGEFNTDSSTPYAVTASHETYPAWRAFDGVSSANTATWLAFTGTVGADAWIQITFPEPKRFGAWRWAPADTSGRTMDNAVLEGSNDSGVTWDLLDTQINQKPSQTSGAYTSMFIISNPSFYTRYRVTGSSDGSGDAYCGTSELDFREMVSVPLDQEEFKNLSDISYTTQFDLRLQLVGDQRFSRMEISTPNTIMEFTKSGEIRLLESDVAYSTLSKIGFTIPKLTTSEKDSLTPSESLMLYNETEANIEFYNGTKWVSGLRKHEEIIGDNSEVNFTITHNFNTRNLTYCILDNNTYEIVDASVSFPTITTALFSFSQPPSTDEYTITIIG